MTDALPRKRFFIRIPKVLRSKPPVLALLYSSPHSYHSSGEYSQLFLPAPCWTYENLNSLSESDSSFAFFDSRTSVTDRPVDVILTILSVCCQPVLATSAGGEVKTDSALCSRFFIRILKFSESRPLWRTGCSISFSFLAFFR